MPAEQLSHLQTTPVRKATWTTTLRTTGTVDWDNDHTSQAITQVSGPITQDRRRHRHAREGGRSAAVCREPGHYRRDFRLPQGEEPAGSRRADAESHAATCWRTRPSAQRDLEAAEADYNDAGTDLETALQALKILGVSQQDLQDAERQNVAIRSDLPMRAPIAGTVVQKLVLPGQVIQAGATMAFVISDISTVWVQGHVYDRDLAAVHLGDKVEQRNPSFPETFTGVVSNIGDLVDPATRTTPVRIVTPNPRGLLKKDLFVDVVHPRQDQPGRARGADGGGAVRRATTFRSSTCRSEPGKFSQRLVKIGAQQGDDIADSRRAQGRRHRGVAGQCLPAVREREPASQTDS